MDRARAARHAWLSLIGLPVAGIAGFLVGEPLASAAGLGEQERAPLWLAVIMVAMLAVLYAAAWGVSFVLCRRAARLGVPRAMLPAWIVGGLGALSVLQSLAAYLFSWA